MTAIDLIKPVIKPSGFLDNKDSSSLVIDYSFISGPKKTKRRVAVTKGEYEEILERVSAESDLLEELIKAWRNYASALKTQGNDAKPPLGSYHKRLSELCDPNDQDRGAVLETVFGEKIEADILLRYIEAHSPSWSNEISVVKEEA